MTRQPRSLRRFARWTWPAIATVALMTAWSYSGFVPTGTIRLNRAAPLALTSDGAMLIAGTAGQRHEPILNPVVVGPIRFLHLATGREARAPLPFPEREGTEYTSISEAWVSPDDRRIAVIRRKSGDSAYFLTVFDVATGAAVLDQSVPQLNSMFQAKAHFSGDGRLMAWPTSDESGWSVVAWDLEAGRERFRVPNTSLAAFSPDGRWLASRDLGIPGNLHLTETRTGRTTHAIGLPMAGVTGGALDVAPPSFSPDGRFVAVDQFSGNTITVYEVASGAKVFQGMGWSAQFLPGGTLLGVRNSGEAMRVHSGYRIPEVVAWSPGDWREMSTVPYDLGASPMSGPATPSPLATGRPGEYAVIYGTSDPLGWTGSGQASIVAGLGLGRALRLNIPRGLALDLVQSATGSRMTYHLDHAWRWYPHLGSGKILLPQDQSALQIWDVPPRRTYGPVWVTGGAFALVGLASLLLRRLATRRAASKGRPIQGTPRAS